MELEFKRNVLRAMADDYENLETVCNETSKWTHESGRTITRSEIVQTLETLINEGLAQAYSLSPTRASATPVEFNKDKVENLWFYLTPDGKRRFEELS
jgi:hypothetical protein